MSGQCFLPYILFNTHKILIYENDVKHRNAVGCLDQYTAPNMKKITYPSTAHAVGWDGEIVKTVKQSRYISTYRGRELKQSGPWSCLTRWSSWLSCIYSSGCVFTLVVKPGIMKFGLLSWNWLWMSRAVNPQNNMDLNHCVLHLSSDVLRDAGTDNSRRPN